MHYQTERIAVDTSTSNLLPTSCGTIVVNKRKEILLCHITGMDLWDLPKGMQEADEPAVKAAQRELFEETGLAFPEHLFEEIGWFTFRPEKNLHLFRVYAPEELDCLGHLNCSSHFVHKETGVLLPEMDGFRWASRDEIKRLCGPRMSARLLALDW